eukprot:5780336-Pyramimonas_sp.AAC.1
MEVTEHAAILQYDDVSASLDRVSNVFASWITLVSNDVSASLHITKSAWILPSSRISSASDS